MSKMHVVILLALFSWQFFLIGIWVGYKYTTKKVMKWLNTLPLGD